MINYVPAGPDTIRSKIAHVSLFLDSHPHHCIDAKKSSEFLVILLPCITCRDVMFLEQFLREHDVLQINPGKIFACIRVTKNAVVKSELKVFTFILFDLCNIIAGKILGLSP
ncbi:MAG: hypothetical protein E6H10_12995 [Bacteroidetes bacterium]|nr:MAG: hypothetical protein E6H10_12995 [Bacteroidota bacterium]